MLLAVGVLRRTEQYVVAGVASLQEMSKQDLTLKLRGLSSRPDPILALCIHLFFGRPDTMLSASRAATRPF